MSESINLTPFGKIIRQIVSTSIDQNFDEEGRFGNGIFGGGNSRWEQSHRAAEQGGKTLQDTGQLAASINVNVQGGQWLVLETINDNLSIHLNGNAFEVTAGSNKPYAAIHQFGGKVTVSVTEQMRKYFWAMHYKEKKSAVKTLRKMYKTRGEKFTKKIRSAAEEGFRTKWMNMALTKSPTFSFTMKPRPYLVMQDADIDKIGLKFDEWLNKQKV